MQKYFFLSVTFFLFSACSSGPKTSEAEALSGVKLLDQDPKIVQEVLVKDFEFSREEATSLTPEDADSELARATALQALKHFRSPKIPLEMNLRVGQWIDYFSNRDRERFERFLVRGEKFRPLMEKIFVAHRVPKDLYYLALIESGFHVHARSWAQAVGIWQFIKSTGSRYGLKSNAQVDYRRDPIRATKAAAQHLHDLHNRYGNWYLALAAYNAGAGRIDQVIERAGSRNFWKISEAGVLPRETLDYVPKFLAAMAIGHHPEKYGFQRFDRVERYPSVKKVPVPGGLPLRSIASAARIPDGSLVSVNPHLLKKRTPYLKRRHDKYEIYVPVAYATRVRKVMPRFAKIDSRARKLISYRPKKVATGVRVAGNRS